MSERQGVPPATAVALALVGYLALAIAGLGVTSLVTSRDVLEAPGAGPLPGVVAMAVSAGAIAVGLVVMLRSARPSYGAAFVSALLGFLGYLLGLVVGAVLGGVPSSALTAAIGSFVLSWFSVVLALAAAVAGWSAVALVRTRAERPRWPWESDEDE
ncbi:hypothetical protein NQ166_12955 [Microbacterium sp. zg.Y1090]|uniref:hypothetical protein n=1 Tax=Microbacterium wangruii TaxID=3049073 RepID=UPI00214D4713|nr:MULTISPECIES: hypothetical protein [unclassified Microbacterium]MCR2819736.1 hypothetical protein [Microbacterium sp. zg.Y1090]WIM28024.1 hypothetical protein QNO26_12875 [Microbacterium sp. zg-Y1090]